MSITKIVLTGGPCSGKTTALSWIQNAFSERGYKVLFIPETATCLISGGVAPWTCGENVDYQKCQMILQRDKEKVFMQAAKTMSYEKILIVCDRGQLDNKAYMTDEEYKIALDCLGQNEEDFINDYDAVFHLCTAAKGAKDFYETINNNSRIETTELAVDLDNKVIDAWKNHTNFFIIDNSIGFEDKMRSLINAISGFLKEREAYEIKKKYLIELPSLDFFKGNNNWNKTEIIETQLISSNDDKVKLRKIISKHNTIFYESRKQRTNDSDIIIVERRLREKQYLQRLTYADSNKKQILKIQYSMTKGNCHFEIEVDLDISNYAILKVELSNTKERIIIPKDLKIIKELH